MNQFVFLTDTHYWSGATEDFGAPKMLSLGDQIQRAVVPAINALSPDFVLHGGDLLCGGNSFDLPTEVFERSLSEARQTFSELDAPFYCVPGNHDCDAQTWTFDSFHNTFGTADPIQVDPVSQNLRVVRANVFLGDTKAWGAGEWTDDHDAQLRIANKEATADGVPIVLCLHAWLLPDSDVSEGEDGRGCVRGASRLLDTVSECEAIIAVFTGHRHLNRITAYRDFVIVDTSCLVGYPFGFREVVLSDDGWFSTRFHRLDLPDVAEAYESRHDTSQNAHWAGQPHDRDTDVLVPRLARIRSG